MKDADDFSFHADRDHLVPLARMIGRRRVFKSRNGGGISAATEERRASNSG